MLTFVALGALIAILVSAAVVLSVRLYDAQSTVVDRLFATYTSSSDLNVALLDQETGFRGYALTGEQTFLEPYVEGRRAARRVQARLQTAESDFPALRAHRLKVQESVRLGGRRSPAPASHRSAPASG